MALAGRLISMLEPLAASHGLDLVTVEVAGGRRQPTVRVFLDRDGGIDIEAIADANPWLSDALDALPELDGPYTLEVSSPGIERVLRTREHFARFLGSTIVLQTTKPLDGRSRFTGELRQIDGDDVVVLCDEMDIRVPFDSIERARLKADFGVAGERDGTER